MIEGLPVWFLLMLLIAIIVGSVQLGIKVAHRAVAANKKEDHTSETAGTVVGSILGLLAFMLAFTFGITTQRLERRRELLLQEVNSIGTTYLRAGLVPEPQCSQSRSLLRKYVDLRIEAAEYPERLPAVVVESSAIQQKLWTLAESLSDANLKYPNIVSLYFSSLNETIDLQTTRLTVASYRIPGIVWFTFTCMTALSFIAVGFNFGLQSARHHQSMTVLLALAFALVTFLILDLDHSNQGWLKVDQQPMFTLRDQLATPTATQK